MEQYHGTTILSVRRGQQVAMGGDGQVTLGNIVVKLPLPPGCLVTFWNADERFRSSCLEEFPGYYKTADAGIVDEDGYVFVMARTDDIINCAGHRLSTGAMEEVCAMHPDVAECAVIGIPDDKSGESVKLLVVRKDPTLSEDEIIAFCKTQLTGYKRPHHIEFRDSLPKSPVGKILRRELRDSLKR